MQARAKRERDSAKHQTKRAARNQRNPADSQAIENSGRVPIFFAGCRFRQRAKNRISGKIKNVAEVSKVPLRIGFFAGTIKTSPADRNLQPENPNLPQKAERFGGNSKLLRKNQTLRRRFPSSAENPNPPPLENQNFS
jgi:hypothetical protein